MNELKLITHERQIKKAYSKMLGAGRRTIALSLDIGNMLAEDQKLKHKGGFRSYVERIGINYRTAYRLIEAANNPKIFIESHPNSAVLEYEKCDKLSQLKAKKLAEKRAEQELIKNTLIEAGEILETFEVIYLDPPWRYSFSKSSSRDIENQYPTMSQSELMELEIPASDNCVIYMWATTPKLVEALELLKHWGFEYKTNLVWDKQKIGMGYWFRGQHELLLVGTKGKFSPPESDQRVSSVLSEVRTEHSKKPIIIYDWLDKWFPEYKKIEMFARNTRDGWYSYGNQINKYDE